MKTLKWIICLVAMVGFISLLFYINLNRSLDPLSELPVHETPATWAESLKIGIIGDSWVAERHMDQAFQETLSALGIPAEIVSSGHSGATSRQIYRDLIAEASRPYSSRHLLLDTDLDYLVVVAGGNDSAGHKGRNFYAHHMLQIIRIARIRGIHPIIVEVPEYGIEFMPEPSLVMHIKHLVYRILFDGGQKDVIEDYRQALRDAIPPDIGREMTLVSYDPFIGDYADHKDLYANPTHLNEEGLVRLGVYLGRETGAVHKKRIENSL